jgi:heme/copper-type cytochrome/quinol oxidase subunit 2
MRSTIHVVSEQSFHTWLSSQMGSAAGASSTTTAGSTG